MIAQIRKRLIPRCHIYYHTFCLKIVRSKTFSVSCTKIQPTACAHCQKITGTKSSTHFLDMNQTTTSTLVTTCLTPWEVNSSDFGLTIMFSHLDSVRNFSKNLSLYHRNAQIVLSDSTSRYDELLEDSFRFVFYFISVKLNI